MTKPKSETSPPVLILYGLDANEQPRAAGFDAAQADLAIKAAESLKLNVLRIETPDQIELARELPAGQILASGKRLVSSSARTSMTSSWLRSSSPKRGMRPRKTRHAPSGECPPWRRPLLKRPSRNSRRPAGPRSMSEIWCSPRTASPITAIPTTAGTRPWFSNRSATINSRFGFGTIPKKAPWFVAATSWRCWHQPNRQCPTAHQRP
jgi:hypothetical protein